MIDTTDASNQPFRSLDDNLILVFNGEIYNYRELRADLQTKGYQFRMNGDVDVLLSAYQHWSVECLDHFNGMWAFAILDRRQGRGREKLFLARDRVGEKPLYYAHNSREFAFASEVKAVPHSNRWDLRALKDYLSRGYVPADQCLFEGVRKLSPGHAATFDIRRGNFTIWRYWRLPDSTLSSVVADGETLADEVWSLLKDSVRLRLRSDVSTGVFLSGGLDSSLITAAAASVVGSPIKTFTISVPGSSLDESQHAQSIADAYGTEHHVLELPSTSLGVLDDLSAFVDEPIADSSILPTFLVSRLTARHVRVALGGDGGDELYGGYFHYQTALRDFQRFGQLPVPLLRVAASFAARLPAGVRGRNRLSSFRGGVREASVWGTPYFDLDLRRRLLNGDVLAELGDDLASPEHQRLSFFEPLNDLTIALTRSDFRNILADNFLVKVDRASMANSLEVRTPWLDPRLVEHAFSRIPSSWKCNTVERRRVQNILARRHLPEEFELDRKQGFSVPMDAWLRNANLAERLEQLPAGLFNRREIGRLIAGLKRGRSNGARLFALLMLAMAR